MQGYQGKQGCWDTWQFWRGREVRATRRQEIREDTVVWDYAQIKQLFLKSELSDALYSKL